ncbi:MAG: transcriptional regulator, MucR family [Enterovirga sp.]|jgi:predicted transcriptional regulator|nr:transcriptional regulator, MucR family [Enterovirga sp.]
MTSQVELSASEFAGLTAEIVSSFLSHNSITASELPKLIETVHGALRDLGAPKREQAPEKLIPPVSLKKSVTPDYLISMEDGRQYKSLKRHLSGRGLTPAQYRAKWGLPIDYPMVAENYAKVRSDLAKASGLGRKREPEPQPARGGRRRAG